MPLAGMYKLFALKLDAPTVAVNVGAGANGTPLQVVAILEGLALTRPAG